MVRESLKHNTLIERGEGDSGGQHLYSLSRKGKKKKTYSSLKRESSGKFVYLRTGLSQWWLGRGGAVGMSGRAVWLTASPPSSCWLVARYLCTRHVGRSGPASLRVSVCKSSHTHKLLTCHIAQVAAIAIIGGYCHPSHRQRAAVLCHWDSTRRST
jgi:hypothetical protein